MTYCHTNFFNFYSNKLLSFEYFYRKLLFLLRQFTQQVLLGKFYQFVFEVYFWANWQRSCVYIALNQCSTWATGKFVELDPTFSYRPDMCLTFYIAFNNMKKHRSPYRMKGTGYYERKAVFLLSTVSIRVLFFIGSYVRKIPCCFCI